MKIGKLKVLAGIFFVMFALFPPNVTATNVHKILAGVGDTDAYPGWTWPTAVVSSVHEDYTLIVCPGNYIQFRMEWTAKDQDDSPYLGSNHTHTLVVEPEDEDLMEKTHYRDFDNSEDGDIIYIMINPPLLEKTYDVTVLSKVQDWYQGRIVNDTGSFTLTVEYGDC